jgi:hypothetical protein
MHPFHRLVRRIAILVGTVGLVVIVMALLNWTTGLVGGGGWELLSLIGGVGALLSAVLTWRLQRLPLRETPRSPRAAPEYALAVAGALVSAFVSYLFADLITAVCVGTLVLVSGALGVWLGKRMSANWPGSDPDA